MKTKTRFAWKQFLKNLAIIAIPVALQNMLTTTGSMIDTMMIAPLGETTVGAVGLCAQFSSLMFAGYWGFFGGGMLFFSQYWGAQDDGHCGGIAAHRLQARSPAAGSALAERSVSVCAKAKRRRKEMT